MTARHQSTPTNGSESSNAMSLAALEAELNLANNGYLVHFTLAFEQTARANPALFVCANGLIFSKGQPPAQYPAIAMSKAAHCLDDADYEAAILDRQAADGLYD